MLKQVTQQSVISKTNCVPSDSYHKTWSRMLHNSVVASVPVGYAMPSFLLYPPRPTPGGTGGGTPGFECRYDQMWTKIKTQTYPWPFSKTPKISTPNIDPKKPPCRISVTQKCPEIIDTNANYAIGIRGRYHESSDCYEYPPPPQKNPGIKISNPK